MNITRIKQDIEETLNQEILLELKGTIDMREKQLKEQKFYKVVRRNLQSARYGGAVQYKVGEFVYPLLYDHGRVKSKLFVFNCLENAKRFIENDFRQKYEIIFECETINPQKIHTLAAEEVASFWVNSERFVRTMAAPEGSYGCDAVKLIKLVEP